MLAPSAQEWMSSPVISSECGWSRRGVRTRAGRVETHLDACVSCTEIVMRRGRASRRVSTRHARVRTPRLLSERYWPNRLEDLIVTLRFWGTRGSIATPGAGTNRFGGNTSCVEVVTKAGQRLIFDCG